MISREHRTPLFRLGDIVATPGAISLLERTDTHPLDLLLRHMRGDWGTVSEADAIANRLAVEQGSRLLSVYLLGTPSEVLWIITEAGRHATTLLLPTEY
ncbi:hypothetical protein [Paraburkholderia sp. SOS3]|uniref:hypothetical protein n=1 Tax=Paraburkholderia sp. SOS3 TaxID=1926494 RepID=UPI00094740E3|nr:hypothetical protein [Paraburkholderia sp. SOS3]APR36680.1 hypothetical protein BTO02_16130 [Paraburkholderia sp. SOS3]